MEDMDVMTTNRVSKLSSPKSNNCQLQPSLLELAVHIRVTQTGSSWISTDTLSCMNHARVSHRDFLYIESWFLVKINWEMGIQSVADGQGPSSNGCSCILRCLISAVWQNCMADRYKTPRESGILVDISIRLSIGTVIFAGSFWERNLPTDSTRFWCTISRHHIDMLHAWHFQEESRNAMQTLQNVDFRATCMKDDTRDLQVICRQNSGFGR